MLMLVRIVLGLAGPLAGWWLLQHLQRSAP